MIPPNPIVSEATQDRLDRARWEYDCARKHYYECWLSWHREAYAIDAMADSRASTETET